MLASEPGLRIGAEKPLHSRSCNIYAWTANKSYHAVQFESRESDPTQTVEPFLTLAIDEGQLLFDALFDAGYRRVDDADKSGEIEANHQHIESLQEIAGVQTAITMRLLDSVVGDWADEGGD